MSNQDVNTLVHLVGGGIGGTVGAVLTSPLDVVKTRLQSSCAHWGNTSPPSAPKDTASERLSGASTPHNKQSVDAKQLRLFNSLSSQHYSTTCSLTNRITLRQCFRHIYRTEGVAGLFRGLGPNLVGVAPSRAIYFGAYAKSKEFYSNWPSFSSSSSLVHLFSAMTAGFICCTATNPLWFVKTRLQLNESSGDQKLTVMKCIRDVYRTHGIPGFYKGLTASYMGISETAFHFVIYEKLKERIILKAKTVDMENDRSAIDFAEFLAAGAISKSFACATFYPHEVARTRMRQEGDLYKSFWQTLSRVVAEDGYAGLYRGLYTQLLRAIPNSAIMLGTYELTVYLLTPPKSLHKDSEHSYLDDDV